MMVSPSAQTKCLISFGISEYEPAGIAVAAARSNFSPIPTCRVPVIFLWRLFPHKIVVFAAVEHSDNPAFVVSLKHLFASPHALSVESVRAKREQFFFGAPSPLAEKFIALARDRIDHAGRELILADVLVQLFRVDGDRFALAPHRHDRRGHYRR